MAFFVTSWLVMMHGVVSLSEFGKFQKANFESEFNKKCKKYPFVQDHYRRLENPGDRYINFVYHENGLRNGGLGDRIGGLVTAAAISVRLNRTLVIRSSNHLGDFMRPYHPLDSGINPKYNYNNWTTWTKYNFNNENSDNTEYDVWWCINNTGQKNGQCSIEGAEDRREPNILYRSNRAYICYYSNHLNPDRADMKLLGANKTNDLFEVAGCLMRLVWWPTDALWESVDNIYGDYWKSHHKLLGSKQESATSSISARKLYDETNKNNNASTTADHPDIWHGNKRPNQAPDSYYQVGMHYRCGDQSYLQHGGYDNWCVWDPNNKDAKYLSNMQIGNPTEIAQCAKAIMNKYTQSSAVTSDAAQHHSRSGNNNSSSWLQQEEEIYFNEKIRQKFIGSEDITLSDFCALTEKELDILLDAYIPSFSDKGKLRRICKVFTEALSDQQLRKTTNGRRQLVEGIGASASEDVPVSLKSNFVKELMFIASDNIKSSESMSKESGHPYSLVSPQGCHIELDPSAECHLFTLSYWLALSLSDVIVTQDLGSGQPTSSFSRYAGIYGLKDNVFRTGKQCERVIPNFDMSHGPQSNWFC